MTESSRLSLDSLFQGTLKVEGYIFAHFSRLSGPWFLGHLEECCDINLWLHKEYLYMDLSHRWTSSITCYLQTWIHNLDCCQLDLVVDILTPIMYKFGMAYYLNTLLIDATSSDPSILDLDNCDTLSRRPNTMDNTALLMRNFNLTCRSGCNSTVGVQFKIYPSGGTADQVWGFL